MNRILLPVIAAFFLSWVGFAPAMEASSLKPGSYDLTATATRGFISGSQATGIMTVSSNTLTFSVDMPKGHSPARIHFKATHNRKSTFVAEAMSPTDVGMVLITVKKANRNSASGTFFHSQGSGTWKLVRRP